MEEAASLDSQARSGSDHVFVYGALMRGFELHHYLAYATFVARATIPGRLYSLGKYPGMVDGDGTVRGELYRFGDIAVALEVLDEIEDYDPSDPQGSVYTRALRRVRTDDGKEFSAWVYLINQDVKDRQLIASGEWGTPPD